MHSRTGGKEPKRTERGPDLRLSRLRPHRVLKGMKIVLDFSPGYSVQVLGKFVHEPVSFLLAKAQSTAPAEVALLGPHVFGEGTGSGRDCKCHC